MAAAVAVVSVTDDRYTWVAGNKFYAIVSIAITVSPATYTTGGIAMSLFVPLIKATLPPVFVNITSSAGYVYYYVPGVDASSGTLKIFVQGVAAGDALAEMANNTAIPAGVSGDTILAEIIFNGML